jgi:hypothetical protein
MIKSQHEVDFLFPSSAKISIYEVLPLCLHIPSDEVPVLALSYTFVNVYPLTIYIPHIQNCIFL